MSLNQRKLYAYNLKQTGTNIQLYDNNKSADVNNKEYEDMNMHLLQMQKSSLDDPLADRTTTVVPPNTEKEAELGIWLNKKKTSPKALVQKSSLDDPVTDRTVTVIKPNTVEE